MTAILPCNDLDAFQTFFERLGFTHDERSPAKYRMLSVGSSGDIHLTDAIEGWLVPHQNPLCLYLDREDRRRGRCVCRRNHRKEGPSDKPWGMYEFALPLMTPALAGDR